MTVAWDYKNCVSVLTGQIELLKKFSLAQDMVRQAVIKREWVDYDKKTAEVNRLGDEFALLDKERADLFNALTLKFPGNCSEGGRQEKTFYAVMAELPANESRELSDLYRELKLEILKIRIMNDSFLAYLNEGKNVAAAYLEAACPSRGGKLYTRKGDKVSQDLRSMVVNNSF